jgi:hypothetical protein
MNHERSHVNVTVSVLSDININLPIQELYQTEWHGNLWVSYCAIKYIDTVVSVEHAASKLGAKVNSDLEKK